MKRLLAAVAAVALSSCTPARVGVQRAFAPGEHHAASSLFAGAHWTNDRGDDVVLAGRGRAPFVVAAIFTTCVKTCPMVIEDLRRLSQWFAARGVALRIVLATLTPDVDTTERLHAFRAERDLPAGWELVRGDERSTGALTDVLDMHTLRMDAHVFHDSKVAVVSGEGELLLRGPSDEVVADPEAVQLKAPTPEPDTSRTRP